VVDCAETWARYWCMTEQCLSSEDYLHSTCNITVNSQRLKKRHGSHAQLNVNFFETSQININVVYFLSLHSVATYSQQQWGTK